MAQVKIYARRALLAERQALISQAVHRTRVSAQQCPEDKKVPALLSHGRRQLHPPRRPQRRNQTCIDPGLDRPTKTQGDQPRRTCSAEVLAIQRPLISRLNALPEATAITLDM